MEERRNSLAPDPRAKSFIDPRERRMLDLMKGTVQPQNKEEQEFLCEVKEIEKQGGIIEFPSGF